MIRLRYRLALACALLAVFFAEAAAQRGRLLIPQRDRRLADRLADRAAQAAERGDRRGAARLFFRSSRWNPEFLGRRRRGIQLIERVDPDAALNQAEQALQIDPRFGEGDPSLIARLQAAAADRSRWHLAAALADRRREIVGGQAGVTDRRRARLDLEHGRLAWLAGDVQAASDSFARFEAVVADADLDDAAAFGATPIGWQTIVVCHSEAGAFDRAARAIDRWERIEGASADVLAARGRLALQRGEPLAAIALAERAVAAGGDDPPYELLISAFRTANQADRSVAELRDLAKSRPADLGLTAALISELATRNELEPALTLSKERLTLLLDQVGSVDLLARAEPQDDPTGALRPAIADAYAQRLRLARQADRLPDALNDAAVVADRLGGLDWVEPALAEALAGTPGRAAAEAWLRSAATADPSPGARRAAATIATLLGQSDLATRLIKQRLLDAIADGERRVAAIDEATAAIQRFERHGTPDAGRRLAATVLAQIGDVDGADAVTANAAAALHAAYASSIVAQIADAPTGSPLARVALRAYEAAVDLDPGATHYAYRLAWLANAQGDRQRAIGVAEQAIAPLAVEEGSPSAPVVDSLRLLLALLLAERHGEGDLEKAIELYENVLDTRPTDATALNGLAYTFAQRDEHLPRALRMARRAAEAEPDSPAIADTLGFVLLRMGRDDEAVAVLADAVERLESSADIGPEDRRVVRDRYAEALSRLGRAEEAETARRM